MYRTVYLFLIRPEGPKERIAGRRRPPEKDSLLLLFQALKGRKKEICKKRERVLLHNLFRAFAMPEKTLVCQRQIK